MDKKTIIIIACVLIGWSFMSFMTIFILMLVSDEMIVPIVSLAVFGMLSQIGSLVFLGMLGKKDESEKNPKQVIRVHKAKVDEEGNINSYHEEYIEK